VEIDGPNTPGGEEEADPAANVVRFPGDWFGPRDELVPFGPTAPGADADESPVPGPVRAQDFWGEESASIHDAMAGPGVAEDAGPVAGPVAPRNRTRARRALAARVRVRWPQLHLPRLQVHLPRADVPRRPLLIAAGVACGCLLVASVIGSLWSGRVSLAHGGRDAATLSPAVIAPAVPPITSARSRGRAAPRRRPATDGRASRTGHTRARASRARTSASAGTRGTSQAVVASTSSSSSVASSTPSDQSSGTAGASSATSGAGSAGSASVSSDSSSGGGGGSGGGGQSSGPVGPGAPFGPGHLG
jgi:hypothetical protein